MSYITTYRKIKFDPINAKMEDIDIVDIAHALSLVCRANGHFSHFYSVAQHCINCANEAKARGYSERVQLACLLHDASEAYLSDITRPVKPFLKEYLAIEDKLQHQIWEKWIESSLTEEEKKHVFQIDDAMLFYEFQNMMDVTLFPEEPEMISNPEFAFVDFAEVERMFVEKFNAFRK